MRHCARKKETRQSQSCESFRKTLQNFFCACFERVCAKKRVRQAPPPAHFGVLPELFFFGDVNGDLSGDVAKDFDGHGVFAEGFDGIGDLDLALVDLEILRREGFGDVGGSDGAEHLIVFPGLARELQRYAIEQSRLFLSRVQFRGGLFRKRCADAFNRFQIAGIGFHGKLARQKEIAGVAGLDGDDVAAMAELFDVFLKNDLHVLSLCSCLASPEEPYAFGASAEAAGAAAGDDAAAGVAGWDAGAA